ncbi:hypothetical protein Zmor_003718 [Zophobas morio]|uniref:Uncharacterized protein n=1 Tax=Zophobas morio TaxID=2755281 RepID=A0AA38HP23_9CUCU|nr:hypothetical protein Zmor_003718 [Zophobas morio]
MKITITTVRRDAREKLIKRFTCGSTAASPILAGWSSALNPKSDKVVVLECTISFTAHKCAPSDSTFSGPNRSDECDSKRNAKEKVAKTNCKRGKH